MHSVVTTSADDKTLYDLADIMANILIYNISHDISHIVSYVLECDINDLKDDDIPTILMKIVKCYPWFLDVLKYSLLKTYKERLISISSGISPREG